MLVGGEREGGRVAQCMAAAMVKGYVSEGGLGLMYGSLINFISCLLATWSSLVESCSRTGKDFCEMYRHVRELDCSPFGRNRYFAIAMALRAASNRITSTR